MSNTKTKTDSDGRMLYFFRGRWVKWNPESQYSRWVITWNNYSEENWEFLKNSVGPDKLFSYLLMSKEEVGCPHIQGYFEMESKRRHATLEKRGLLGCWFEPAKGNVSQNQVYMAKNPIEEFEAGVPIIQRQREGGAKTAKKEKDKWAEIRDLMKSGKSDELEQKYPGESIRYNLLPRVQYPCPDEYAPHCMWIWGPKHTGKSEYAYGECESFGGYFEKPFNKWWDNYQGQPCVILTDPTEKNLKECDQWFFALLNKNKFCVEVKGGSRMIRPKVVMVTANMSLEQAFLPNPLTATSFERERYEAIKSRFTVRHFTAVWTGPSDRNRPFPESERGKLIWSRHMAKSKRELEDIDQRLVKRQFVKQMEAEGRPEIPSGHITSQSTAEGLWSPAKEFIPDVDGCPPDGEEGSPELGSDEEL